MQEKWHKYFVETRKHVLSSILWLPFLIGTGFFVADLSASGLASWRLSALVSYVTTFIISWCCSGAIAVFWALVVGFGGPAMQGGQRKPAVYLLLSLMGLAAGLPLSGLLLERIANVPFNNNLGWWMGSLFIGVLITLAVIFRNSWRVSRARVAELERATIEAQYQTLRAQLQPHFLFNSLNSLSELIEMSPGEAALMTGRLADLYRRILGNSKEKTCTLASELAILRDYLDLERLRFGRRLTWKVACEVNPDTVFVPSLLLQTLVENAVKHGISPAIEGGDVLIAIHPSTSRPGWVSIEVSNSGAKLKNPSSGDAPQTAATQTKAEIRSSTGTGLTNAKQRLALLYGTEHGFFFGSDGAERTVVRFSVSGERHE